MGRLAHGLSAPSDKKRRIPVAYPMSLSLPALRPEREDLPYRPAGSAPRPGRRLDGRLGWAAVAVLCIGLAAASLALQNAPHFDPWGWIVWGREVLHLDLNTTQGPSWKPGAVLFTTVFALFGGLAPSLWVLAVRLGALMAVVFAYRIAARLGGRFAGVLAAVLLLVLEGFFKGALYGEAEPLMVGLFLGAVDQALIGRERSSLVLLLLASLLRPEVWPILFAYSVYLWLRAPNRRLWVIGAWALLALLWFGGDWWGSGSPFLSSTRAKQYVQSNPSQNYAHPGLEVLKLEGNLLHRSLLVLAILGVVIAGVRRRWIVLILAASSVAMLVAAAAMAQDGYPVLARFLFGSLALAVIVAAFAAGEIVRFLNGRHLILSVLAAAAIVALLVPPTVQNTRRWGSEVRVAKHWAHAINTLPNAIAAAGGRSRITACRGTIATYLVETGALAWDLDLPMTRVLSWSQNPNGIVFIHEHQPLSLIIPQTPLKVRRLGRADTWRVLSVLTRRPGPRGC